MEEVERFFEDIDSILLVLENRKERFFKYSNVIIVKTSKTGRVYMMNRKKKLCVLDYKKLER